jgi:formamidopyrimidine-DNA glycosylase
MAELPDIELIVSRLREQSVGKKIIKVRVTHRREIRDSGEALSNNLKDQKIMDVSRYGKELRFLFSNGQMLEIRLMKTGSLFLFNNINDHSHVIAEFSFNDGSGLALTDPLKKAKASLNPVDTIGVDALSEDLTFNYLKSVFSRKLSTIKKVLMDQSVIRGIGGVYSDEILWETRISPFSRVRAIPDDEIQELEINIKKVLNNATAMIKRNYQDEIPNNTTEVLKIHGQVKSPTGFKIHIDADRGLKTYYTLEQMLYRK